jgi:hypothetical protein
MTEVQNPAESLPQSSIDSQSLEKDALVSQLDELLEQYLNTLDEYQKIRVQLSKQLSSVCLSGPMCKHDESDLTYIQGYLTLAQANFQNRSTTIHYGQDCYDERMRATRKV